MIVMCGFRKIEREGGRIEIYAEEFFAYLMDKFLCIEIVQIFSTNIFLKDQGEYIFTVKASSSKA